MKLIIKFFITAGMFAIGDQIFADDALDELIKKYGSEKPADKPVEKIELKKETPKPVTKTKIKSANKRTESAASVTAYTIQVESFIREEDAIERKNQLISMGYSASYKTAVVNDVARFRVNIGLFESQQNAKEYLADYIDGKLQTSAIIKKIQYSESDDDRSPASTTSAKPSSPRKVETKEAEVKADATKQEETEGFLFGDWLGLKSGMKDKGVDVLIKYKGDFVRNVSGGLETKTVYLGNLDIVADFDLEKLVGLKGLNFVLYGLENHGGQPTQYIGDSFASSNIEAPSTFKIYEAYLQQTFDDRFVVLFGLRDLNADYNAVESSGVFLNSAFGISPSFSQTGVNGPSIFPTAAPALTFKYESPTSLYFQTGIFNATAGDPNQRNGTHIPIVVDNGYLYVWELGFAGGEDENKYKYGVGTWSYSKAADATDTTLPAGLNSGFYFLFDKNITKDIAVFAKHGLAAPKYNQFSSSTEVGVTYQGLVPGRPDDVLGLGWGSATIADDYKLVNGTTSSEHVTELSYQINLPRGISLTPDFQYVKNPGGVVGANDAKIGSLRLEVKF